MPNNKPVLLVLLTLIATNVSENVIINTTNGLVEGKIGYNGRVRSFLSIPYASPPVKELRWKNPVPHSIWDTPLNATIPSWGCPQECSSEKNNNISGICPPYTNEDCLILSIFTPNNIDLNNTAYPIMIYFHGGGWTENYGGGVQLNASNVVNQTQNVIIVLANYRLGALGMLYDPQVNISGNFGHYDQLMAIQWIYNNSIYFGGDPNSIIMYGESAGANSGALHLIQNESLSGPSYISGIIMESTFLGQRFHTENDWGGIPAQFSELLNCSLNLTNSQRLKCLKSASSDSIVYAQQHVNKGNHDMIKWSMTVQNDLFYDQALLSVQNKIFDKNISIIIGSNNCEACFSSKVNKRQNSDEFYAHWNPIFGEDIVNKMISYYNVPINVSNAIDLTNYSIQIQTDSYVKCPSRYFLKLLSKYNDNKNTNYWFYHFMYSSFDINSKLYSNQRCWSQVCHTEDLWWVFNDDLQDIIGQTWNEQELILKNQFISYWTNFAAKGNNPNWNMKNINIKWNAFNVNNNTNTLLFDIGNKMKMVQNYDNQPCDFWDNMHYQWLHGYSS